MIWKWIKKWWAERGAKTTVEYGELSFGPPVEKTEVEKDAEDILRAVESR